MSATRTIVVVGGGPAGAYAALAAKKQDPAAAVMLLTDEPCEPYEKPPLSKAVLLGRANAADAPIAGPGGLQSHGVTLEQRARCIEIDREARHVRVADGRALQYEGLVIATGAVVRELAQLPPDMPGVHYLRDVADANALKFALLTCRHLLVVGGGLIGLEAAAAAAELGIRVTVIELAPRVLARVCYAGIGELVLATHQKHGVEFRLGAVIRSAAAQSDGRIALELAGETVIGDAVVVGTGAKPDDRLAAAAGLETRDGIIVDERCRTADPAIFAAGDVARFPGPGGLVRLENWRHAIDHGTVAGRNAAGADEIFRTVPSFWSEQYDLYIQGVGWAIGEGPPIIRQMPGRCTLSFEVSDGRLVYALGVNAQRDIAMARRLIERGVPVVPAALADPAQPLAAMLKRT